MGDPIIKKSLIIDANNINGFKRDHYFSDNIFPIIYINGKIVVREENWFDSFVEKYLTPNDISNGGDLVKLAATLSDFESTVRLLTKLLGDTPPEDDVYLFLNYLNYVGAPGFDKVFSVDEFGFIKINPRFLEALATS